MGDEAVDSEATFAIEDEDHTLANALRFMLNKNPHVVFCGYSIPHPTETVVNLRIQTSGEMSAAQALREACHNVREVCSHMKATFLKAVEEYNDSVVEPMEQ
eukprot:jgi/Botrbrau1/13000/Bobra.384_1s0024.1